MKKYQKEAKNLTGKITPHPANLALAKLTDENGNAAFETPINNLLFIQAASNYVEVHYLENGNLKKKLIRNTLSKIEQQLPFDNLKKCHRSYLANLNLIEKFNSSNLNLISDIF